MSDNKELEESINKWEDIIAGNKGDKGQINCSLCQKYLHSRGCAGCIVRKDTEQDGCHGTPFSEWFSHHGYEHGNTQYKYGKGRRIECPTCLELAQKELDYLKSLRA